MANLARITDKQTLEATFREWCHQDSAVDGNLEVYLQQCEDRINENLRITEMEATATRDSGDQRVSLPLDFLDMRRLVALKPSNYRFHYLAPDQFWDHRKLVAEGGEPQYFTIEGTWFVVGFVPQETHTYEVHYYKRWDPLIDPTDTNWLLQNASGVYLFGMLLEQATENEDIAAMGKWEARFASKIASLERRAMKGRYPAGKRTRRSVVAGP